MYVIFYISDFKLKDLSKLQLSMDENVQKFKLDISVIQCAFCSNTFPQFKTQSDIDYCIFSC